MSEQEKRPKKEIKEFILFSSIGAIAALVGFSSTLAYTKKRYRASELNFQGLILGYKALGIATIISFIGFGGFCWGITKLFDIKDIKDLQCKARHILPKISKPPKNTNTEKIETFEDLMKVLEGKN